MGGEFSSKLKIQISYPAARRPTHVAKVQEAGLKKKKTFVQRLERSQGTGNPPALEEMHRYPCRAEETGGENGYHKQEGESHIERAARRLPEATVFSQKCSHPNSDPQGMGQGTRHSHLIPHSCPPGPCCGFPSVKPDLKPEGKKPLDADVHPAGRKQGG